MLVLSNRSWLAWSGFWGRFLMAGFWSPEREFSQLLDPRRIAPSSFAFHALWSLRATLERLCGWLEVWSHANFQLVLSVFSARSTLSPSQLTPGKWPEDDWFCWQDRSCRPYFRVVCCRIDFPFTLVLWDCLSGFVSWEPGTVESSCLLDAQ